MSAKAIKKYSKSMRSWCALHGCYQCSPYKVHKYKLAKEKAQWQAH